MICQHSFKHYGVGFLRLREWKNRQSGVCILIFAIKRKTIRRQQEQSYVERVIFCDWQKINTFLDTGIYCIRQCSCLLVQLLSVNVHLRT